MHLALLSTNTQSLIDLLEEIFGDSPTDSDIEELEAPALKCKHVEASTAEQADATSKGECDPSKAIKYVHVVDDATPVDYGINPDLVPTVTDVIVKEPDGKESTRVYYQCKTCPFKAQNRASMMNHTHKCLNIRLHVLLVNIPVKP